MGSNSTGQSLCFRKSGYGLPPVGTAEPVADTEPTAEREGQPNQDGPSPASSTFLILLSCLSPVYILHIHHATDYPWTLSMGALSSRK